MAEPRIFTPKTQQSLERTLEATRKAMSDVRENMSILEEAKERADQRIENLTEELAKAREALADSSAAQKTLRKDLAQQASEQKRVAGDLAALQGELENLHKQLQDASAERAALTGQSQEALAAERARAETLCAQLEDVAHSLEEQQAEQDRLLAERDKGLQAAKRELAEAQARAKRTASDADAQMKRFSASEERCATLQAQLEEAVISRQDLENKRAEDETRVQELVHENQRVATLEENVAALGNENQALTGKLQEALDEVEGLNAQLVSEQELRETLEVSLDVSRRVVDELKQALAGAQETSP